MTAEQLAEIEAFSKRHSLPPSPLTGPDGWGVPVYADLEDGAAPECRGGFGAGVNLGGEPAEIHVSDADFEELRQKVGSR
jgi:hypothetical protein